MRCLFLFFFSSRRRHTRLQGDWSSDVCSSDLVELAYTTSQRSLALRVVDQCIAIHGSDPAQWRVGNEFDELTSAGALCAKVNALAAGHREAWAFMKWDRHAISFLRRGMACWNPGADPNRRSSRFALLRLGETYASILRYPQYLDPGEQRKALDEGVVVVQELGRIDDGTAYQASRQLAAIVAGQARQARVDDRPAAEIDELVDRADELYRNARQHAFPEKRQVVAGWHAGFLFEF